MQDWVAEVIGDKGILEDNKGLGIDKASMRSWKSLRCLVDMSGHDAQVSRGLTRGEATGMVRQRRKLEANQVFSGFPPCILSSQAQGPGFGPRLWKEKNFFVEVWIHGERYAVSKAVGTDHTFKHLQVHILEHRDISPADRDLSVKFPLLR